MTAEKTTEEAPAEAPPVVVNTSGATDNKNDNPDHFDEVF